VCLSVTHTLLSPRYIFALDISILPHFGEMELVGHSKARTKSLGDVLTASTSMIDKIPPPIKPDTQEESSSPKQISFESDVLLKESVEPQEAVESPVAEGSGEEQRHSTATSSGWKATAPSDPGRAPCAFLDIAALCFSYFFVVKLISCSPFRSPTVERLKLSCFEAHEFW
jgi:hypothetical protein